MARQINQILGGAVIAPWEIDQMPDEIIDAVLAVNGMREVSEGLGKVENIFAEWRSKHAH